MSLILLKSCLVSDFFRTYNDSNPLRAKVCLGLIQVDYSRDETRMNIPTKNEALSIRIILMSWNSRVYWIQRYFRVSQAQHNKLHIRDTFILNYENLPKEEIHGGKCFQTATTN